MRHSKLPACGMQHARRHLQLATPLADIIDGIRSALKAHYEYPHECSERILIEPTADGPRLGPARTCCKTFTANYLQQFFTVVCHNFSHSRNNNNNNSSSFRCSFTEFPWVFSTFFCFYFNTLSGAAQLRFHFHFSSSSVANANAL